LNYGLLAVASSRSKEALFPLNNPPNPDNVRSGMLQCFALHAFYDKETQANFKICKIA